MRYLVMAIRTPQFQSSVIEAHREYLSQLRKRGLLELSGPFTDKTGGAYIIKAESSESARNIAHTDPIYTTGSSVLTIYEWDAS